MTDREGAVALYRFLSEFAQLRTTTVRDVSRYEQEGQVIWAADVPCESGCDCIAWRRDGSDAPEGDGSEEVWLEIRRPRPPQPPQPPAPLRAWVRHEQLGDSSLDLPELRPTIRGQSDEHAPLELDAHPEVQQAWDVWIEKHWWPWAERDRRERAVRKVYTELFSMYQRQQSVGERFEVVFGLGLLSWNVPGGYAVQRHLVAAQAAVSLDPQHGTLTVTPAGEGARPTLELDMLDPQHRPDPQELHAIEETLQQIGDSLWAPGPLDALLRSWAHSASAEGEYRPSLERQRAGPAPVVQLAPALILRRRTERSFIRAFQRIIEQLEDGDPVPEGVARFISISKDGPPGTMNDSGNGADPEETYFPLPANKAQRDIIQRLATNQGVLVQGPPGTGKSHTIVNLICHALANGRRVLVTSHTVRALKVLRHMILEHAPDLAPLAVVLLGDDRDALDAMEGSVQGITTRHNTWNAKESHATIARLDGCLDRARRREAKVLQDLRVIRERETRHEAKFGYNGTLARIAETLRGERESLSWIPDDTPEDIDPPLAAGEFSNLVSLFRNKHVEDWEAGGWVSVDLGGLPAPDEFEQAVRNETEASDAHEINAPIRQRPEYFVLEQMVECDRRDLADGLERLIRLIEQIERRPLAWTETATKEILGGLEHTWRQLYEDTLNAAKSLGGAARALDANPITPPPTADLQPLRADANALLDHLRAGGRWGFGPLRPRVVKRALYIRDLRIGGRPCATADAVGELVRRVDGELEVLRLRERWGRYHDFRASTFTDLATELQDLCAPVNDAFAALSLKRDLAAILERSPGSPEPEWYDPASLRRYGETVAAVETTSRYDAARGEIESACERLKTRQTPARRTLWPLDPTSEEIRAAIVDRDARKYASALQRAADNVELAAQVDRKRELLHRMTTGAPVLADEIKGTFAASVWDERAGEIERAWNWSRAYAWVKRLIKPGAEEQHRLELDHTKQNIARTLERIAAEKAWTHCFTRMTENERQHLVAWSKSVRSIGRGTGKYAPQHRRNARQHLDECRSAIPAWVMPLHRAAETITPGSEVFDLAIIDEASQSGPEALLLAFLAKKLVVVGDDQQIHPTYAGVHGEDVNELRKRHLAEFPHADAYGVDHSFFDLAEIRYQGRIRLREHFRCMPEIIQFSNNLSYADEPLIPLRQYGAGRLEPTVATRHVPDGYQQGTGGRSLNPPEAEAIVQEVVRLCCLPAYAGKQMGVISLVGGAQARRIETRLVTALGPEEMERRQLVCGDAYAFQGDERDVMFLSLVSAPREGRRIPAMTRKEDQRRFNVAASRARDQLFLFYTATLDDLNPECMRHKLLKYCLDPRVAISDVAGLDRSEIERVVSRADRLRVSAPYPFESWFELDVFLCITRRGYRVISQFEVAGYRIDLVVQGMDGSVAVECDGDAWHGADQYERDAGRQRDLERCGWTFWRVRESAFRLDSDEALAGLWETLKDRGIFPAAEDDRGRSQKRRAEMPPSGPSEPIAAFVVHDPLSAQGQREPAAHDDERHPERPTGQPPVTGGNARPSDQAAVAGNDPPRPGPPPVPERSPEREGISPDQPILLTADRPAVRQGIPRARQLSKSAAPVAARAPYGEWASTGHVPDPRTARQGELIALLAEVARYEGPVVAIRAYRLIDRASGSRRLTALARRALNRACAAAVRTGVVAVANPLGRTGQAQLVLRSPESPEVIPRERGPRELDELPPDEIGALLRWLSASGPVDADALKRQARVVLGWARLTRNISEFLDECMALM